MDKWFKGKNDAPSGVIPDVGEVGPGVLLQARDAAHAKAIQATGFYEVTAAPKVDTPAEVPAEAPAESSKDKKAGK